MCEGNASPIAVEIAERDKVRELRGKLARKLASIYDETSWIAKDKTNQQQGYKYASADSMFSDIRHAAAKVGVFLMPLFGEPKIDRIPNTAKGRVDTQVVQAVTIMVIDADTGFAMEVPGYGEAYDTGDKAISKGKTAALKYTVRSLFMIPTGDDPDATTPEKPAAKAAAAEPTNGAAPATAAGQLKRTATLILKHLGATDEQKAELKQLCHERNLKAYEEIVAATAVGRSNCAAIAEWIKEKPLATAQDPTGAAPAASPSSTPSTSSVASPSSETAAPEALGDSQPVPVTIEFAQSELAEFALACATKSLRTADARAMAIAEGCTTAEEAIQFVAGYVGVKA